jgi:hypothetical protein
MGATESRLTKGSLCLVDVARKLLAQQYSGAVLLYSVYTFSPVPEIEETAKKEYFPDGRYVGRVNNAVHEADAFVRRIDCETQIPTVLIFTDEWLSRSIRLAFTSRLRVQRKKVHLVFVKVPTDSLLSSDSPVKALHHYQSWAFSNLVRHFIMVMPGGKWSLLHLRLHQPTAK